MCVYTPEHGVSELFDAVACSRFLLGRGTEGVRRGSVQRSSPPHSRKTHLLASALGPKVDSWGMLSTSSSGVPFLESGIPGQHLTKTDHQAILGACYVYAPNFVVLQCPAPLFLHRLVLSVFLSISSCRAKVSE